MSANVDKDDDLSQRYHQRLNELTLRNNTSQAHSLIGSLSESSVGGQYFNNAGQIRNGALTTHQFYNKNSNQNHRLGLQLENMPSTLNQQLVEGSSTYNDASVFKKPLPVIKTYLERRFDFTIDYLRSVQDKPTRKFILVTLDTLAQAIKSPPPPQPVDPIKLSYYVHKMVEEEYLSKRIQKSICGSSVISDQPSTISHYAGSFTRSNQLERTQQASTFPDARVVLQDITQSSIQRAPFNMPPPNLPSFNFNRGTTLSTSHQQETSVVGRRGQPLMDTMSTTATSAYNLNDSLLALRRDEAAARPEVSVTAVPVPTKKNCKAAFKPTPKPTSRITNSSATTIKKPTNRRSKESAPGPENCTLNAEKTNKSVLNETVQGVSRSGRTLKAPVKYWNSKGEEWTNEEHDESIFNESMTLRNKKVIDKTPSAKEGKIKPPTIPTTKENFKAPASKKSGAKQNNSINGKQIVAEEKKKPGRKPSGTGVVKTASKEKTNNKKRETVQKTEKAVRKSAPKRKSKESDNSSLSKKKKVEVEDLLDSEEEDDIFGGVSYKKKNHQNIKDVLSPSAALLSAKKAAGEAQGRATPPCKMIGDLMNNESMVSIMSAAKEAPKQNDAIKRLIKKMEKDQKKPNSQQSKAKAEVKKARNEDSQSNKEKSTFFVNNPMCSATLTLLRGEEGESDLTDIEVDDDDDDLM